MKPSKIIPAEDWPPYRWLWTRVVLARDPNTGEATPYTHGFRRNTKTWLPVFALFLAWNLWGARASWWRVLLAFLLGALAGHLWW